jgi:hypothetical protein
MSGCSCLEYHMPDEMQMFLPREREGNPSVSLKSKRKMSQKKGAIYLDMVQEPV